MENNKIILFKIQFFSDWLNKPSVGVPSAETFVSGAIRTLGVADRTTGYWAHSLQNYFAGKYFRGCGYGQIGLLLFVLG